MNFEEEWRACTAEEKLVLTSMYEAGADEHPREFTLGDLLVSCSDSGLPRNDILDIFDTALSCSVMKRYRTSGRREDKAIIYFTPQGLAIVCAGNSDWDDLLDGLRRSIVSGAKTGWEFRDGVIEAGLNVDPRMRRSGLLALGVLEEIRLGLGDGDYQWATPLPRLNRRYD